MAGVALRAAEQRKATTYWELVDSPVLCLATVAHETGGRANLTARKLLDSAASAKVRSLPTVLQPTAARAWRSRWTTLLSVAVQRALALTLVDTGTLLLDAVDGVGPDAVEVWLSGAQHGGVGSVVGESDPDVGSAAPPSLPQLPVQSSGVVAAPAPYTGVGLLRPQVQRAGRGQSVQGLGASRAFASRSPFVLQDINSLSTEGGERHKVPKCKGAVAAALAPGCSSTCQAAGP